MTDTTEVKTKWYEGWTDETLAFLVLRLWLAVRAIITGVEKFSGTKTTQSPMLDDLGMPDISGKMIDIKTKIYSFGDYHAVPASLASEFAKQPLLPKFILPIYYGMLGPALILLGLMLLFGIGTRTSLFLQGLLYVSLTFGLILIGQDGGIAWLAAHMILIAYALTLAKHNKLAVMSRF